ALDTPCAVEARGRDERRQLDRNHQRAQPGQRGRTGACDQRTTHQSASSVPLAHRGWLHLRGRQLWHDRLQRPAGPWLRAVATRVRLAASRLITAGQAEIFWQNPLYGAAKSPTAVILLPSQAVAKPPAVYSQ